MTDGALTPTSYAILGLLAVRPWTTYELAKQVDRTLHRFWPRTRSKLYEEPKKLVAQGLAEAEPGAQGRRPRTVYTITPAGRRALAAWLAAPSSPPVLESEALLKVFYAESGTTADLRATLQGLRAWVGPLTEENVQVGREYVSASGPYPDRLPVLVLTSRFLDDYLELVDRWCDLGHGGGGGLAGPARGRDPGPGRAGRDRPAGRGPGPPARGRRARAGSSGADRLNRGEGVAVVAQEVDQGPGRCPGQLGHRVGDAVLDAVAQPGEHGHDLLGDDLRQARLQPDPRRPPGRAPARKDTDPPVTEPRAVATSSKLIAAGPVSTYEAPS